MPQSNSVDLAQDIELRLAEARGQLSGNDERIARYLRDHLDDLAFQTADSLAQGAGVSAAAVVRFSRRLGFASFRELRERSREELRADGAARTGSVEKGSVLERKTTRDIASLELLPRLVGDELDSAADAISAAEETWVLANRETHGLALYAFRLMHHASPRVRLVDPSFPDPLRSVGEGSVVLAISFRPYSRQTASLIGEARAAGARIVLVTDGLSHDFIDPADVVLAVPVDSPTPFLSFTPALCVLEALAAVVAGRDPDRSYEAMEKTARFVEAQRLMLEREDPVLPPEP